MLPYGQSPEPVLTSVGDISLTQHEVIVPMGRYPVSGSVWTVSDMSRTEEKISTAGIVLAIVFVWFCLLGLLFLLMKERRTVGFIQVSVQGEGFHHATLIPAHHPGALAQVMQQVNYARSLAAQPPQR
jgi:hypothetical protein